jgi:hypothetical protein
MKLWLVWGVLGVLGIILLGAAPGLAAYPVQGAEGHSTLGIVALDHFRASSGWLSILIGCLSVTHARRLLK